MIGDLQKWPGIIQALKSSKASKRAVVDDRDLVAAQVQDPESSKSSERPVVDDGDIVVLQAPLCRIAEWQRRDIKEWGTLAAAVHTSMQRRHHRQGCCAAA